MYYIQLDKTRPISTEQQLYQSFVEALKSDLLIPEDRLPSEEMVSETFKIAKALIQKVYDRLTIEGYVYRNPKGGTFVQQNQKYLDILDKLPFIEKAFNQKKVHFKVLINEIEFLDETTKRVVCTHILNGRPVCVSHVHMPKDQVFDSAFDFVDTYDPIQFNISMNASNLNKTEALYFNVSDVLAVYDFMTYVHQNDEIIVTIHQWVHPLLGDLILEDIREL